MNYTSVCFFMVVCVGGLVRAAEPVEQSPVVRVSHELQKGAWIKGVPSLLVKFSLKQLGEVKGLVGIALVVGPGDCLEIGPLDGLDEQGKIVVAGYGDVWGNLVAAPVLKEVGTLVRDVKEAEGARAVALPVRWAKSQSAAASWVGYAIDMYARVLTKEDEPKSDDCTLLGSFPGLVQRGLHTEDRLVSFKDDAGTTVESLADVHWKALIAKFHQTPQDLLVVLNLFSKAPDSKAVCRYLLNLPTNYTDASLQYSVVLAKTRCSITGDMSDKATLLHMLVDAAYLCLSKDAKPVLPNRIIAPSDSKQFD